MADNCLTDVMKATGLSKEDAVNFVDRTDKLMKQGVTPEKLLDDFLEFKDKRASYIKKMQQYNLLRDRTIVTELKQRVMDRAKPENQFKLGPLVLSNPVVESVLSISRQHFHHRNQLFDRFAQKLDGELDRLELMDYAKDPINSKNIYIEMANLGESVNRSSGTTGDSKAFQVAKVVKEIQNAIFQRKAAAGATTWYRKDFIFAQKYNPDLIRSMSDDRFVEIMNQIKYDKLDAVGLEAAERVRTEYTAARPPSEKVDPNTKRTKAYKEKKRAEFLEREREIERLQREGIDKARRDEIIKLKREIESKNFVDPDNLVDEFSNSVTDSSLAEFTGRSRRIEFTPEQYTEFGEELFQGRNFIERAYIHFRDEARILGDLETFGSKPSDNFNKLIDSIIAESKNTKGTELEPIFRRGDKSILETATFQSTKQEQSQLAKVMFGQRTDNEELAKWLATIRGLDAVSKLGGAAITSITDLATRAVRDTHVSGNQRQVFPNLVESIDTLIKATGDKEAAFGIAEDTWVGVQTMLDDWTSKLRYEDQIELAGTSRSARVREGLNYASQKLFKLNGLEALTQAQQKASFYSSMSQWARLSETPLQDLNKFARSELELYGVTPKEWDFIRSKSKRQTNYGNDILSPTTLNNLKLDDFADLAGSKDIAVLTNARNELVSKWEGFLRKETNTATLMPDVVDSMRITRGFRPGTVVGEAWKLGMMYKSFAFGFAARVLMPTLRYGNMMTQVQYFSASAALAMLSFTLKDLAKGRTPRDFTEPQNVQGVVGHIMGLPFVDQLMFTAGKDNVQASGLYDIFTGPVIGDGVETTARVMNLMKDDDPDFGKFASRTFLPMLPVRNHWATTGFYNRGYNEIMKRVDPRFEKKYEEILEKSGQKELF